LHKEVPDRGPQDAVEAVSRLEVHQLKHQLVMDCQRETEQLMIMTVIIIIYLIVVNDVYHDSHDE
jgi:hypothetical protein